MSQRFSELASLAPPDLEALLKGGQPMAEDALVGALWHGYSLALPAPLFAILGRFGKAFHREPGGQVRGWNVRMRQKAPPDQWVPLAFRGRTVTYGHYRVIMKPAGALAAAYPHAFLIDYSQAGNRPWDPLGRVRDWVVALDADLLLGRMYLALGGRSVPTPSYFALARGEPLAEIANPPVPPAR